MCLVPSQTGCFYPDSSRRHVPAPCHRPTHVQVSYRRVLDGTAQICGRNCAKRRTARMLPAPYSSPILGPCIFLAHLLLPWSPQKQVLQPPAQLRQPHCLGSTLPSEGMLSTCRAGHRAGALPWSISPATCGLRHLLSNLHQNVVDLCHHLPGGGLRRG